MRLTIIKQSIAVNNFLFFQVSELTSSYCKLFKHTTSLGFLLTSIQKIKHTLQHQNFNFVHLLVKSKVFLVNTL